VAVLIVIPLLNPGVPEPTLTYNLLLGDVSLIPTFVPSSIRTPVPIADVDVQRAT
jgi:hypothetical protein